MRKIGSCKTEPAEPASELDGESDGERAAGQTDKGRLTERDRHTNDQKLAAFSLCSCAAYLSNLADIDRRSQAAQPVTE